MSKCVVTLVHGTFAPHAPWVQPGSRLREALARELGTNVEFQTINWTGRNRFKDRFRAVEAAAASVAASVQRNPDAAQFIIGHSHGGNIALGALNDAGLAARVAGVVCLSTPFLLVKRRRFEGEHNRLFLAAQLAPMIAAWVWILAKFGLKETTESWMFLSSIVIWPVSYGLFHWLTDKARLLADRMRLPPLRENQLLILRHSGDEAGAVLSACALAGSLIEPLLGSLNKRWEAWEERRKNRLSWFELALAALVGWAVADWIIGRQAAPDMSRLGVILVSLLAGGLLGPMVYLTLFAAGTLRYLLLGGAFVLLMPAVGVLTLPFGPEAFAIGLFMQVTAEATPPGRWLVQLFASVSGDAEGTPLTHSAAYEDPAVLEAVCAWIKQSAAAAPAGAPSGGSAAGGG